MDVRKFVYRRAQAPREQPAQLFATPLLSRMLARATPEFLAHIRAHVLELEARDQGVTLSNVGGWHSSGDLFETSDQTMLELGAALLKLGAEMSYLHFRDSHPDCSVEVGFHGAAWANVSRDGDYNKPHVHPGALWSGVFYVDLGERDPEPADNGALEFIDPRPANAHAVKRVLHPKPGQAVIFPGWLSHYVNPFRGRGARISIAFNVNANVTPLDA